MNCRRCGYRIITSGYGRAPKFCSTRCRVAAHRARNRMPAELTDRRAWTRRDGKRPIRTDGKWASSTKSWTWASFTEVLASQAGDGIGIMLGRGLGCYDLDHCLDGVSITSGARRLLESVDPIWVERSMSGDGLHVFVHAEEGPGTRRDGFEFYSTGRFIAVTGDLFEL